MRHLPVVFVFVLTAVASAQQRGASHQAPAPPPPPPHTTAPRTVAPPMVLPLPPLPQQPAGGLTTPVPFTPPQNPTIASPDLYRVRPGVPYRTHSRLPYGGYIGGGYVAGDYGTYPGVAEAQPPGAGPDSVAPPSGLLRLDVSPASAQVFVDSFFVGSVADIDARRVLTLAAGPHRIEIRAPDYQPATFDVRIDPNDTITYRAALEPVRPAAAARPAAGVPSATKMYVIPNCYLGNVPPRADRLPKGCDAKQVHVVGGP